MPKTLVVTNPFAGKELGEPITDADEVEAVLSGEHAAHVVATETAAEEE